MVINGNQLNEYVNTEMRRMGFDCVEEMMYVDQLWRQRFGIPLPRDYQHEKRF